MDVIFLLKQSLSQWYLKMNPMEVSSHNRSGYINIAFLKQCNSVIQLAIIIYLWSVDHFTL